MTDKGKTFLITGAASGIGAALARLVAHSGNRVVVADIDIQRAQEVAAEIGPLATALKLDVCSEVEWGLVLDEVWSSHGKLDVLVNNAAIVHTGYARHMSMEQHLQTLDVNFFGPMRGMIAGLPRFNAQGYGHLVTICSMASFVAQPAIATYAASKHALRAFHLALAFEERDSVVNFTLFHPGMTETPMLEKEAEDDTTAFVFAGTPVSADFIASSVLRAIETNAVEAFAPEERASIVKTLSVDPESYWKLLRETQSIGTEKLMARRAAKAAPTST